MKLESRSSSSIAWMAANPVAANLLMLVFLIGGAIILFTQVKQEIFPEFEVDLVKISIAYPGASPEEVEKGVVLAVEEAIGNLDVVKKLTAVASEGKASIDAEIYEDEEMNKAVADIKNEIDRISSFPEDVEEPQVSVRSMRREVLSLVIYGDVSEKVLREMGEQVRDDLLTDERITQVDLDGIRSPEISIEVSREQLRAYDLTLDQIASEIRRSAVDLPAGGVKTRGGEILLRTTERRDIGREFEDLVILRDKDGTRVRLGDIATIVDGFDDEHVGSYFNGKRAVRVDVYRTGDQTPLTVAAAVQEYRAQLEGRLPPGVQTAIWRDRSETYHQRVDLLTRNAWIGLILVIVILGLFLEIKLAFWVTLGIPISFLGAFLFLPMVDVSINMISLFGFIVTLGMVVDDAIVVGENIYVHRQMGLKPNDAAVIGAMQVSVPVVFAILTTIAAFAPMFFVSGTMGKVFRILPAVVVSVLVLSLIESLYILPAHLAHSVPVKEGGFFSFQQKFGRMVENFARFVYGPIVEKAVAYRWITLAIGLALLMVTIGWVNGGRIAIEPFPKIESDSVEASAELPFGVAAAESDVVKKRLEDAAFAIIEEENQRHGQSIFRGMNTRVRGTHSISVTVLLVPTDQRNFSGVDFSNRWRKKIGPITGVESLSFDATAGGPRGGKPVDVQLSHRNIDVLKKAAVELAEKLKAYEGIQDVDDGFADGKAQINFRIRPEARSLGLTATELGRQLRHHFYGSEAIRQQRGRDLVKVMVRLPENERSSEFDIEEMIITTPDGGEIPLSSAAWLDRGRSYTAIFRTDGQRNVHVSAELDFDVTSSGSVLGSIAQDEMPGLLQKYPGLTYTFEGGDRSRRESMASLKTGFLMAVLVMYVLIAIPLKSYLLPLVVLSAIPFGFVGAVIGHIIMGYSLSLVSMMGLVALSGVVVNDSLLLVHTVNRMRSQGKDMQSAVIASGIRRFRPIILTSVTTFFGLTPMIFETSLQARFMIPMAISLGFGVLFATGITLLMVPSFYIISQDIRGLFMPAPPPVTIETGPENEIANAGI